MEYSRVMALMDDKTFDPAKWCKHDIAIRYQELYDSDESEVTYRFTNPTELSDFCDAVIDWLEDHFDASIGINWHVIEDAINEIIGEWE